MASSEASISLDIASENCAKEPIHIPGSIQPQGFMLVFDATSLQVLQASENVREWLGVAPDTLLSHDLHSLVLEASVVSERLQALPDDGSQPFHVGDVHMRLEPPNERSLAMVAHRYDQVLIAEFEATDNTRSAYDTLYPLMHTFIGQLQEAESIEALLQLAVHEVKRVTGFGRIKAYRFDADDNGLVLAETADPGYPSYLGLCFPASDIPPQARALYCANRIRVIEDANYQPSPLHPPLNPRTGKPLDMTFAALRSVSPVHLQYMRNMQTQASLSISLVVRGRLWGMISGHHASAHAVGVHTRTACELLGRVLSLQIEAKEAQAQTQHLLSLRQHIVQLLSSMADRDSISEGLLALPEAFVGFAQAEGAAIISAARCDLVGRTPPQALVNALVHWLSQGGAAGNTVFHTDNVSRDIDELPELGQYAAGVLAVAISQLHSHYLIWFKPEQTRTVTWAGKPEKSVSASGALNPRHSFERWQQTYRGYSTPWDPLELTSAAELRTAVLGIVLRKAEEVAQLAGELKKSNKELEAFSYSVSHDLRAPLRHIAGYAELLGDFEGNKLSERGLRFLEHIGESARFAGTLVDNLLNFSQMGRAALRFSEVNLQAMIESIQVEMQPDYAERNVVWRIQPMPVVIADAAFIHLVLRNLLSNALKYSRTRDPAIIEVGTYSQGNEQVLYVRDNGVGFDMEYANKLFGVFQRLHRMEEFEGTGIGLASVRRIIERHDGRVWAEGKLDEGAIFYIALPNRPIPPLTT
ncbi:MAG: GAF domain-containing protein [Gammaproteobacteria bacterium]|nr:GAF domain-containing protein [Gammaproteobacteria bacterium]MBU1490257.1 GAF domain-containing protein [Gammaproteobacteria bacterium]MBU2065403.1 GAF domain-containing protein [Gammaproteobacteria bacterium]MBU2139114.1 GAF domain-containing protein [Gammaproteobacteria bacterium]MBU2215466.1 GAF domain-containing protein [Gammaproteobacteria bacterium]